MNRNHLALFHAVAQAGGISAGAAAARVSQPAVSKQIAELESALGVRLLERLPRGCRLTEAGEILASYAARWRTLEADAAQAIEEYRGLKRGRLNVGASLTIAGYLLPRALAEFHRRYPEIELRVRTANTRQIQAALLEGSLELGLTEGVHDAPELDSAVFLEDELVAIAPAKHRFLKRGDVTAREFCREPLILREPGSGTRAAIEQALRRKKLNVEPLLSLGSPEAIKGAVRCGMGLAIVSRLSVDQELRSGALAIVALQDLTIRRPLRRQRLRGRNESPAAARFREVLVAVIGDR